MDDGRAVEQHAVELQRQADHGDDGNVAGCLDDLAESLQAAIQQRLLLEQVFAGISRKAEFGKNREQRLLRCMPDRPRALRARQSPRE
jgi:hypothetical protein